MKTGKLIWIAFLSALARYWSFRVTESGILGWDHNPSDYTRVYILELVEKN